MNDYGLFQYYTTTSTTTIKLYRRRDKDNDHIELNDTAPLPLLIGIGLTLFIGIVLLLFICCCCRRSRVPSTSVPEQLVNKVQYQRAPVNDGMGFVGGPTYPLTAVSPTPYLTSVNYPPSHMGHMIQHNYGVIDSDVKYSSSVQSPYMQQPAHFGGVPPFSSSKYAPTLPLPTHIQPLSHSSHTSSSGSGTASDPLVPPTSLLPQHHHQSHQQHLLQFPQSIPPMAHQHLQQHFISGRQSPAIQYQQVIYPPVLISNHGNTLPSPNTITAPSPSIPVTEPQVTHPPEPQVTHPLEPPQVTHPLEPQVTHSLEDCEPEEVQSSRYTEDAEGASELAQLK